jgi:hypothetical protein
MGHVRKRGERQYQARWFDDAGRERVKTFKLKGDADRHVKRMDAAVINGDYIDLSDPTTVTDAAWKWLKAHEGTHSSGTQKRNSSLIKQHIAGTELGRRRLVRVTNTDVQEWVSERAAVLAPRTVKLAVQTIRAVFNQAVADRRITTKIRRRSSACPRCRIGISSHSPWRRCGRWLRPRRSTPERWSQHKPR